MPKKKLIILALLGALTASTARAELWNKVIATFDDEVLTYWEIKREMTVERMKQGQNISQAISPDQLKEMTKKVMIEKLVFREAQSFGVTSLSQKEKNLLFQKFQNKFGSAFAARGFEFKKFMSDDQWSEEELKDVLSRSVVVERFIKDKILSAYIYVTGEEIKAFQKRSQGSLTFKQAKEALIKIRLQENLKDWIENIKRRSRIKTLWD
ncbi:MAG: hypothetical protein HYY61_06920 [Deltaproteobacteria bacterium]|nr:hypothetical protein [Deltaproteobacteria bacterium]